MSRPVGRELEALREESSDLVEVQPKLCTSEMSSMVVDIFKALGELSPDIEEFYLLFAALVPRRDVHHPKNAVRTLFYVF